MKGNKKNTACVIENEKAVENSKKGKAYVKLVVPIHSVDW